MRDNEIRKAYSHLCQAQNGQPIGGLGTFGAPNLLILQKNKKVANDNHLFSLHVISCQVFEDEDYYICHDGRELRHSRTESREQDGYTKTTEVYGCADRSLQHKLKIQAPFERQNSKYHCVYICHIARKN